MLILSKGDKAFPFALRLDVLYQPFIAYVRCLFTTPRTHARAPVTLVITATEESPFKHVFLDS